MDSINAAAVEAYALLRTLYPEVPIGVIGESLGSGPASYLCSLPDPPARAVLIVPFDNLAAVAGEHFPFLPVGLLLRDKWDNVAALAGYAGRVDIYAHCRTRSSRFIMRGSSRSRCPGRPITKWTAATMTPLGGFLFFFFSPPLRTV